jgi:hypothetical protein
VSHNLVTLECIYLFMNVVANNTGQTIKGSKKIPSVVSSHQHLESLEDPVHYFHTLVHLLFSVDHHQSSYKINYPLSK